MKNKQQDLFTETKKKVPEAISALKEWISKTENGFLDAAATISATITFKKCPPTGISASQIVLKHSHLPEDPDVCLFVADHDKKARDYQPSIDAVQELLDAASVSSIKEILPIKALQLEHLEFEAKRNLSNRFDCFLADGRVAHRLAGLLGKAFLNRNRYFVRVDLQAKDLKQEIDTAVKTVLLRASKNAPNCQVTVGHASLSEQQLADNVMSIIENLHIVPGGAINVKCIHLKTPNSPSLPVYMSLGKADMVVVEEPPKVAEYDPPEELSTIIGAKIKVRPSTGDFQVVGEDKLRRKRQAQKERFQMLPVDVQEEVLKKKKQTKRERKRLAKQNEKNNLLQKRDELLRQDMQKQGKESKPKEEEKKEITKKNDKKKGKKQINMTKRQQDVLLQAQKTLQADIAAEIAKDEAKRGQPSLTKEENKENNVSKDEAKHEQALTAREYKEQIRRNLLDQQIETYIKQTSVEKPSFAAKTYQEQRELAEQAVTENLLMQHAEKQKLIYEKKLKEAEEKRPPPASGKRHRKKQKNIPRVLSDLRVVDEPLAKRSCPDSKDDTANAAGVAEPEKKRKPRKPKNKATLKPPATDSDAMEVASEPEAKRSRPDSQDNTANTTADKKKRPRKPKAKTATKLQATDSEAMELAPIADTQPKNGKVAKRKRSLSPGTAEPPKKMLNGESGVELKSPIPDVKRQRGSKETATPEGKNDGGVKTPNKPETPQTGNSLGKRRRGRRSMAGKEGTPLKEGSPKKMLDGETGLEPKSSIPDVKGLEASKETATPKGKNDGGVKTPNKPETPKTGNSLGKRRRSRSMAGKKGTPLKEGSPKKVLNGESGVEPKSSIPDVQGQEASKETDTPKGKNDGVVKTPNKPETAQTGRSSEKRRLGKRSMTGKEGSPKKMLDGETGLESKLSITEAKRQEASTQSKNDGGVKTPNKPETPQTGRSGEKRRRSRSMAGKKGTPLKERSPKKVLNGENGVEPKSSIPDVQGQEASKETDTPKGKNDGVVKTPNKPETPLTGRSSKKRRRGMRSMTGKEGSPKKMLDGETGLEPKLSITDVKGQKASEETANPESKNDGGVKTLNKPETPQTGNSLGKRRRSRSMAGKEGTPLNEGSPKKMLDGETGMEPILSITDVKGQEASKETATPKGKNDGGLKTPNKPETPQTGPTGKKRHRSRSMTGKVTTPKSLAT